MVKVLLNLIGAFAILTFLMIETGYSQWGVGATYEVRGEEPTHGVGLRIDHDILESVPVLSLTLRAHLSYFRELQVTGYEVSGIRSEVRKDVRAYDFGGAVLAGANAGIAKPYAGLGLGLDSSQFFTPETVNNQNQFQGVSEENVYWNVFAGAEFTLIPVVHPFIEYRLSNLINPRNIEYDKFGRIAFGLVFRF